MHSRLLTTNVFLRNPTFRTMVTYTQSGARHRWIRSKVSTSAQVILTRASPDWTFETVSRSTCTTRTVYSFQNFPLRVMKLISLVLVMGLSLLGGQCDSAAKCSPIEENTDYIGNDINQTERSSADHCCGDCANTPRCSVYVWTPDGRCLLKSEPANKANVPGTRAARLVLQSATCSVVQADTDLSGNDIGHPLQLDSPGDCCTACANTPRCRAYVLVVRDGIGVCLLKSDRGSTSYFPGAQASFLLSSPPTSALTSMPTPSLAPLPVPTPLQCAPVLANTDYPGNDLVILQLATVDLCCSACTTATGCAAFVWAMRDVGTCILKSIRGSAYPSPGATASYMTPPTSTPTPSACPIVEPDVDYPGNDIIATSQTNSVSCCADCQATPGCFLYVWSSASNTCFLKSKKSVASPSPGALAAVLPPIVTPLPPVQSTTFSSFPLPVTAFSFIVGAQWIDGSTMQVVTARTESLAAENRALNLSHASSAIAQREAFVGIDVFINVTSVGECAALTAAWQFNFFTYDPTNLFCFVNVNTPDTSMAMVSATGAAMTYPQSLDMPYKTSTRTNVASSAACVQACHAQGNCAGVVYTATAQSCAIYQPQQSNDPIIVAGWVHEPVTSVDTGAIQYSRMAMASLPQTYVKDMVLGVATLNECAVSANQRAYSLFGFNTTTNVCSFYMPVATSALTSLSLVNTPSVSVLLGGATFGADVLGTATTSATSVAACYKRCIPSQSFCMGSVFDAVASTCALVQASFDAASTLGWIVPPTLPTTMATVQQVDFYVTAHQDDHELFMSTPVYESIKSATTKAVFVYTSAGDAGQTDNWFKAREYGTLAASKAWINMFGAYSPVATSQLVVLSGHQVEKSSVGNTVHYFLRLSEDNLDAIVNRNMPVAPMDQPNEVYADADAVKSVLKAIILAEAHDVAVVTASYNDYVIDPAGDHTLHVSTGRLTAELLNGDPLFRTCVSQVPYFGYQHWLDTVNMMDPALTAQRAMWLQVGVGLRAQYPQRSDYWSEHSPALGRVYMGTPITKPAACTF
ncbi:Aste57867_2774 [Aphanomyces stellatus]|uniref:Aste57867_2774 protein n=1 Tax=Aphanomyces stellatus TaxID=120398 RepID=A0A485K9C5_9STRA|nr:hypothetical protein As57867_002767 [Aphanomyces stellatus]VFT79964.1 Aste57867_2774 [Aphanomyces stellatus]